MSLAKFVASAMVLLTSFTPAASQETVSEEATETIRYRYTGDGLIPVDQEIDRELLLPDSKAPAFQLAQGLGYAKIDPSGKIESIFTPEYLGSGELSLDKLPAGYGIQAVNFFGRKQVSAEEVQTILVDAFNSTFDSICAAERKLQTVRFSTEIGIDFGVTAKVILEAEMKPREDCQEE
ncbi:hypothetical protein [Sinisalibacter lacisalsi]|uniref:DUF1400 domain-containing protein n=1 Tax=Sinisalibacter lacisalsi TaxID=1526570 RepID=A0ABQ1QHZ9_9RHOB|nr:hypothetical protein [Sinisalibacter lacisalsi]GGD25611.1 hypothetical protein GCM10011358_07630 [Sinisalibacter lacisalsi]